MTDSTLISIRKQETALLYHLLGASAGVYAVMRERYWKDFNYMHLDPKLWDEKEKHLNKKYKRRLDT
jgi:tRNA A22 N-methylase